MIQAGLGVFSDILLGAGALGAAFYCFILSRKLGRLTGLDQELGSAIALLSQQVDEMTSVLEAAQNSASQSQADLDALTQQAGSVASELEGLILASKSPDVASVPINPPTAALVETDTGGLKDGTTSLFVRHNRQAAS